MNLSDEQKIVSIMKENFLHAYLATCDGDQPRVRPVSPIVEADMSIWVTTGGTSRKVKQIKKNPKICLFFTKQPNGDKSAIILGKAKIASDLKTKKRIWKICHYNLSGYFPKGPESPAFCLLKILPNKIEWWDSWKTGRKTYKL
jgi:general stress protein 26